MKDPSIEELNPELRKLLQQIREVPERAPGRAAQSRAKYLAMARRLAVEQRASVRSQQRTAVSETPFLRLKEWIGSIFIPLKQKERFSMVSLLTTIAIVLGLVFGGAGATVLAAQESLPGQALYNVKTISEDARLDLTTNPDAKFQLALVLANRRAQEIGSLLQDGELIPQELADRLHDHMQLALKLTANMEEVEQTAALLTLQRTIRDQDRVMGQGRVNAPDFTDPVMAQIQNLWTHQRQLIDSALETPFQFRQQFKQGVQELEPELIEEPGTEVVEPEESGTLDNGYGPGPNDQPGVEPFGPNATPAVPGEINGYGPGYPECDPLDPACEQYDRYQYNEPAGSQTPPGNDNDNGNGKKP
jgi:hypothetical protein